MDKQPLGRYILIAFIFVLIFVGVAYLAYRLSRRDGSVTPTPTPTATYTSSPVTSRPGTIIPPVAPPARSNPNPVFNSPTPYTTIVPTKSGASGSLVVHDGKGNILVNNLSHEENFELTRTRLNNDAALEQDRINNAAQLAQTQELTRRQLELARIQSSNAYSAQQTTLATEQLRQKSLIDQLLLSLRDREAARASQAQIETARLQAQRQAQQAQMQKQPSAKDQIDLLYAQAQSQAYVNYHKAQDEIEKSTAQTQNQYVLNNQQYSYQLKQLDYTKERQVIDQAAQIARARNDQEYALNAATLRSQLDRLQQTQNHRQSIELTKLRANIEKDMLAMQSYVHRYSPHYGGYGNYGMGGCSMSNYCSNYGFNNFNTVFTYSPYMQSPNINNASYNPFMFR